MVADVNGDGRPDIVTANFDSTGSVLLNQGQGQFQAPQVPTNVPNRDIPLLQDLTGDHIPDALSLNASGELLAPVAVAILSAHFLMA